MKVRHLTVNTTLTMLGPLGPFNWGNIVRVSALTVFAEGSVRFTLTGFFHTESFLLDADEDIDAREI